MTGPERGVLLITHYTRILNYIVPDKVYVLHQGRIIAQGEKELAHQIEAQGYDFLIGDKEKMIEHESIL